MSDQPRRYWEKQAGGVALRHNLGWWLAGFLKTGVFASVAFACGLLIVRKAGASLGIAWMVFGVVLLSCGIRAAWRLRSKWYSRRDGMVRLDATMRLHNRLVSAAEGVGEFPAPLATDAGLRWRWAGIGLPFAGSVLLVATAAWIPLGSTTNATAAVEVPPAWQQVETWMDRIEEQKLVDEQRVRELREKLDALKDRPKEDWYSHDSLEAGEHLREQTAESIRELERNLETASAALAALNEMRDGLSEADLKKLDGVMAKAIEGLELGNLSLDKEMLANLRAIDPKSVQKLSKEQLAEMSRRLKEGAGVCKECVGIALGEDALAALVDSPDGWGLDRGPGTVPLNLNKKKTDLHSTEAEGIRTGDMSRALPGDVVGLSEGEHDVDRSQFGGPVQAGGIQSVGQGGDAVWRDTLTPEERETLKRFFK